MHHQRSMCRSTAGRLAPDRARQEARAAAYLCLVVTVHRDGGAVYCPAQGGVGGAVDELLDGVLLVGRERTEHVVGCFAWPGLTDADAQAGDVIAMERGDHGAHAVMRARATAFAQPQRAE